MGSTLRIKFVGCLALLMLSGCSFFDNSVQTCEEPQEYQESASIPPLIVPGYLRDIQNKSVFNIPNAQGSSILPQENFVTPMVSNKSLSPNNQRNQMTNIEGDELSELLKLIDQTISNRQLEEQYEPIYQTKTVDYEVDPSGKPCLDGPPNYFTESISPRAIPTQAYTQPSEASETEEEEKSRRQKRREKRQQKTGKLPEEGAVEEISSKDSEEPEEDKSAKIFKVMTESVIGAFTGGSSTSTTIAVGSSVRPPTPVKPGDSETKDSTTEIDVGVDTAMLERVRNLALSNPALTDEERVFIQNMSDKQILEIAAGIMQESQDKDSSEGSTSDSKRIEKKVSTTEEDDWFTRVKDQWTEGKAQREARREARQQRKAERQDQAD